MTEVTADAAAGGAKKKGWLDGASPAAVVVLAVAVVAAVWGGAEAYSANSQIAAMKAQLAAAGLDATTPDRLDVSIAAKQRELIRLENALVAKSAAAVARDAQVARAAGKLGTLETALAEVVEAEAEADASFRKLSSENRMLSRRVSELASSAVSWEAAAGARRGELDGLLAEVEANKALVADVAMWRDRGAALTAEQNRLSREVVGLENQVVSLAAAVAFRQQQVADASVKFSSAESAERIARVTTLELQAEADRLSKTIVALSAEHKQVAKDLNAINNRFIPALAAVQAREAQLQKLSADTAKAEAAHHELAVANADLEARMGEANARIAQITEAAGAAAELLTALNAVLDEPVLQAAIQAK